MEVYDSLSISHLCDLQLFLCLVIACFYNIGICPPFIVRVPNYNYCSTLMGWNFLLIFNIFLHIY